MKKRIIPLVLLSLQIQLSYAEDNSIVIPSSSTTVNYLYNEDGCISKRVFSNKQGGAVPLSISKSSIEFRVGPVPVVTELTIEVNNGSEEKSEYDYIILNTQGFVSMTGSFIGNNETINVSSLATGQYVISFYNRSNLLGTCKFIKQ